MQRLSPLEMSTFFHQQKILKTRINFHIPTKVYTTSVKLVSDLYWILCVCFRCGLSKLFPTNRGVLYCLVTILELALENL